MSNYLTDAWDLLRQSSKSQGDPEREIRNLRLATYSLLHHLEESRSEAQSSVAPHRHETFFKGRDTGPAIPEQPAETAQSEPILSESSSASPEEITRRSERQDSSSARTSSLSERGQRLEDWAIRETRLQMSKIVAPTSSTPSTDRSTGPSVSIDKDLVHYVARDGTRYWATPEAAEKLTKLMARSPSPVAEQREEGKGRAITMTEAREMAVRNLERAEARRAGCLGCDDLYTFPDCPVHDPIPSQRSGAEGMTG